MGESASQGTGSTRAWGNLGSFEPSSGVRVVILSGLVKLALPPLFLASLPRRAIGFSYPSGAEGRVLGGALAAATGLLSLLLLKTVGLPGPLAAAWLMGGTAGLIIYNSTRQRIAFVKQHCETCRLRPLIEEHEAMHLMGEPREEVVWAEARRKYTYDGLQLGADPRICSFCPIAKKLRDH